MANKTTVEGFELPIQSSKVNLQWSSRQKKPPRSSRQSAQPSATWRFLPRGEAGAAVLPQLLSNWHNNVGFMTWMTWI